MNELQSLAAPADERRLETLSAEVRAQRRFAELTARGDQTDLATVLADVQARDARDRDRADAPLRAAEDATVLDTTDLSIEAAVAAAIKAVEARR